MDPAEDVAVLSRLRAIRTAEERGDSRVQRAFSGATVFITGGTGFLGKQLIEKLFRSCRDIKKVYLLSRDKKGVAMEDRLKTVLQDPVFDSVRAVNPGFERRLVPVAGDVQQLRLGLSDDDWNMLAEEVNIIYHAAATVRFEEPIKLAILTNVRGTREMIELAKNTKNLRAFVHVSTAFTNCKKVEVFEKFYPSPVPAQTIIEFVETVDESRLDAITPNFQHTWRFPSCGGCLSIPRLTYSLRTAPVWLHREESKQYDEVLKDLLEAIVNISMSNEQVVSSGASCEVWWAGFKALGGHSTAAFLASSCGVLRLVTRILHVNGDEFSIPHAAEALELWQSMCPESAVPVQPERQRDWDEEQCRLQLNMLMLRKAGAELARLRAVSQPESGLWPACLPSPQLGTLLDNDSLRVAVALRLGCTVVEPHVCVCGARCGQVLTHHAINDIVRRALVSADVPAVLEPPGLSRADGKRPDGLTMVPWEKAAVYSGTRRASAPSRRLTCSLQRPMRVPLLKPRLGFKNLNIAS
ncbi:unnamed protein product [Plutella xylostella]|uniref:Fatty acyl-CoA reductase n=1 Tax=Plutella xylostella TaxID=51655 RepID=A0A8S4FXK3_PLUXY|nr:unnamed protein product [Plutella xylostella]